MAFFFYCGLAHYFLIVFNKYFNVASMTIFFDYFFFCDFYVDFLKRIKNLLHKKRNNIAIVHHERDFNWLGLFLFP